MSGVLNKAAIKTLPVPEKGNRVHYFRGATVQGKPVPAGFGVRVTAAGARVFVLNYRAARIERRMTIGDVSDWSITDAVKRAREVRQQVDRGEDPMAERKAPEPTKTVEDVLDHFIDRAAKGDNARIGRPEHYVAAFDRLVKPAIGKLAITELKRRHVVELREKIENENGPVMARRSLAYLQSALNWYATQDEEFVSPIVRGMARSSGTDRARDRILTDDEIRALWPVFEKRGNFGKACQFMLLTGARLSPTIDMTWTEISEDGATWSIPSARSMSKRDMVFPLSTAAQAIIAGQPRKGPRVFPSMNGRRASGGHEKKRIDELAPGLEHWTIYDLRRTALSLLSRAGVRPDIAARVPGHVAGGDVDNNVYDRRTYMDEKRDAVEKLAVLIGRILNADATVVRNRRA